jgi:hypothetical protein
MKELFPVLAGLALMASAAAAQDQSCSRCDNELELDQPSWNCLLSRLDNFKKNDTSIVFFTLTAKVCAGDLGPEKGVKLPPENQSGKGPRVYRLAKWQIDCLDRRAVNVPGPLYRVNFYKLCTRSAARN